MKDSINRNGLDLDALREQLASKGGQEYWRSLDELANTEEFQDVLYREFPEGASEWNDPVGRRRFLKLMGASLAFAGVASCTSQPVEKLVPFVRQPEELVPGKPLYFASAVTLGGFGSGVLVESHMGRPTKIEGNKEHPASLGATDVFAQASVLSLYDPDRSQTLRHMGRIDTWSNFVAAMALAQAEQKVKKGAGLRLLTETVTSPTLAKQIQDLFALYPGAKWHQYDPVGQDNARAGGQQAFGQVVQTRHEVDQAKVILSLDADFLSYGPAALRSARAFVAGRRVEGPDAEMNRLYVVESTPSNTGAMADHRLSLRASQIEGFAREIAEGLGLAAGMGDAAGHGEWVGALVRDLVRHRGECLVVAGEALPPNVHALVHAMNHALGNVGKTVFYSDPVEAKPVNHASSLRELTEDMAAGRVDVLVMLGGNPLYTAPADLDFETQFKKVNLRVHLASHENETSVLCHWHIPEAHALEAWSDVRAFDGTVTLVQPLIEPLYGGKSAHELLAVLDGKPGVSGYDIARAYWKAWYKKDDFERFWRQSLHDGVVAGTTLEPRKMKLKKDLGLGNGTGEQAGGLEVVFRADSTVWDGQFSNNGWLQELPKTMTRLTWDNAALLAPSTAQRLDLNNGDVVELVYEGRTVKAPVWILPGQPLDSVTVHLGYGRTQAGRVGTGAGFNAYSIRTSTAPWFGSGLEIRKTGEEY